MSDPSHHDASAAEPSDDDAIEIPNIAAQANARISKRTFALGAIGVGLAVALAAGVSWKLARNDAEREAKARESQARTAAAMADRVFDAPMTPPAARAASAALPAASHVIPAIKPLATDGVQPIDVQGGRGAQTGKPRIDPTDAPMLLAPSKSNASATAAPQAGADPQDPLEQAKQALLADQQQLRRTMASLQQRMAGSPGAPGLVPTAMPMPGAVAQLSQPSLPQAQPQVQSQEARMGGGTVTARQLADASLTMPMGTVFTCSLQTRVISAVAGHVKCILPRAVFGADGSTVLLEKGTQLEGEYQVVTIRPGTTRIPVLWTRARTPPPNNVIVDLDSPATGALGETGLGGYVDNRWGERIGMSLLLSLIDDAVKVIIADKQQDSGATVVFGTNTAQTGSRLAEQVLAATINIPPLMYANQGDTVGVYVRHDVDFSQVYQLRPQPR